MEKQVKRASGVTLLKIYIVVVGLGSTQAHRHRFIGCVIFQQFLVSISKENSTAMEVLDSVSHSVRVNPENLRLAEVSAVFL